ncbi:uncharacterized protein TOT_020000802 [Theileria orientalis strain Shintoku]|uniref:Uncharacterized protein n=1 Tax=Theileria orientalis strain Shintoku TaxID=869250 RepID=J4CD54_THEOR|nr:uncharacterized protein TOT_020000802 [Theileria orientalis strain Shintoku]BAM40547.1 uncharacterized protein TOT_020000802 [Theileria orientalis strain Shintoku]|eukprot:XP_009690848.1 uncharacterized protein TOT_020000802 [Theileria orientalis strain Shintoku]
MLIYRQLLYITALAGYVFGSDVKLDLSSTETNQFDVAKLENGEFETTRITPKHGIEVKEIHDASNELWSPLSTDFFMKSLEIHQRSGHDDLGHLVVWKPNQEVYQASKSQLNERKTTVFIPYKVNNLFFKKKDRVWFPLTQYHYEVLKSDMSSRDSVLDLDNFGGCNVSVNYLSHRVTKYKLVPKHMTRILRVIHRDDVLWKSQAEQMVKSVYLSYNKTGEMALVSLNLSAPNATYDPLDEKSKRYYLDSLRYYSKMGRGSWVEVGQDEYEYQMSLLRKTAETQEVKVQFDLSKMPASAITFTKNEYSARGMEVTSYAINEGFKLNLVKDGPHTLWSSSVNSVKDLCVYNLGSKRVLDLRVTKDYGLETKSDYLLFKKEEQGQWEKLPAEEYKYLLYSGEIPLVLDMDASDYQYMTIIGYKEDGVPVRMMKPFNGYHFNKVVQSGALVWESRRMQRCRKALIFNYSRDGRATSMHYTPDSDTEWTGNEFAALLLDDLLKGKSYEAYFRKAVSTVYDETSGKQESAGVTWVEMTEAEYQASFASLQLKMSFSLDLDTLPSAFYYEELPSSGARSPLDGDNHRDYIVSKYDYKGVKKVSLTPKFNKNLTKVVEGSEVIWEKKKGCNCLSVTFNNAPQPTLLTVSSTNANKAIVQANYYYRNQGKWEEVTLSRYSDLMEAMAEVEDHKYFTVNLKKLGPTNKYTYNVIYEDVPYAQIFPNFGYQMRNLVEGEELIWSLNNPNGKGYENLSRADLTPYKDPKFVKLASTTADVEITTSYYVKEEVVGSKYDVDDTTQDVDASTDDVDSSTDDVDASTDDVDSSTDDVDSSTDDVDSSKYATLKDKWKNVEVEEYYSKLEKFKSEYCSREEVVDLWDVYMGLERDYYEYEKRDYLGVPKFGVLTFKARVENLTLSLKEQKIWKVPNTRYAKEVLFFPADAPTSVAVLYDDHDEYFLRGGDAGLNGSAQFPNTGSDNFVDTGSGFAKVDHEEMVRSFEKYVSPKREVELDLGEYYDMVSEFEEEIRLRSYLVSKLLEKYPYTTLGDNDFNWSVWNYRGVDFITLSLNPKMVLKEIVDRDQKVTTCKIFDSVKVYFTLTDELSLLVYHRTFESSDMKMLAFTKGEGKSWSIAPSALTHSLRTLVNFASRPLSVDLYHLSDHWSKRGFKTYRYGASQYLKHNVLVASPGYQIREVYYRSKLLYEVNSADAAYSMTRTVTESILRVNYYPNLRPRLVHIALLTASGVSNKYYSVSSTRGPANGSGESLLDGDLAASFDSGSAVDGDLGYDANTYTTNNANTYTNGNSNSYTNGNSNSYTNGNSNSYTNGNARTEPVTTVKSVDIFDYSRLYEEYGRINECSLDVREANKTEEYRAFTEMVNGTEYTLVKPKKESTLVLVTDGQKVLWEAEEEKVSSVVLYPKESPKLVLIYCEETPVHAEFSSTEATVQKVIRLKYSESVHDWKQVTEEEALETVNMAKRALKPFNLDLDGLHTELMNPRKWYHLERNYLFGMAFTTIRPSSYSDIVKVKFKKQVLFNIRDTYALYEEGESPADAKSISHNQDFGSEIEGTTRGNRVLNVVYGFGEEPKMARVTYLKNFEVLDAYFMRRDEEWEEITQPEFGRYLYLLKRLSLAPAVLDVENPDPVMFETTEFVHGGDSAPSTLMVRMTPREKYHVTKVVSSVSEFVRDLDDMQSTETLDYTNTLFAAEGSSVVYAEKTKTRPTLLRVYFVKKDDFLQLGKAHFGQQEYQQITEFEYEKLLNRAGLTTYNLDAHYREINRTVQLHPFHTNNYTDDVQSVYTGNVNFVHPKSDLDRLMCRDKLVWESTIDEQGLLVATYPANSPKQAMSGHALKVDVNDRSLHLKLNSFTFMEDQVYTTVVVPAEGAKVAGVYDKGVEIWAPKRRSASPSTSTSSLAEEELMKLYFTPSVNPSVLVVYYRDLEGIVRVKDYEKRWAVWEEAHAKFMANYINMLESSLTVNLKAKFDKNKIALTSYSISGFQVTTLTPKGSYNFTKVYANNRKGQAELIWQSAAEERCFIMHFAPKVDPKVVLLSYSTKSAFIETKMFFKDRANGWVHDAESDYQEFLKKMLELEDAFVYHLEDTLSGLPNENYTYEETEIAQVKFRTCTPRLNRHLVTIMDRHGHVYERAEGERVLDVLSSPPQNPHFLLVLYTVDGGEEVKYKYFNKPAKSPSSDGELSRYNYRNTWRQVGRYDFMRLLNEQVKASQARELEDGVEVLDRELSLSEVQAKLLERLNGLRRAEAERETDEEAHERVLRKFAQGAADPTAFDAHGPKVERHPETATGGGDSFKPLTETSDSAKPADANTDSAKQVHTTDRLDKANTLHTANTLDKANTLHTANLQEQLTDSLSTADTLEVTGFAQESVEFLDQMSGFGPLEKYKEFDLDLSVLSSMNSLAGTEYRRNDYVEAGVQRTVLRLRKNNLLKQVKQGSEVVWDATSARSTGSQYSEHSKGRRDATNSTWYYNKSEDTVTQGESGSQGESASKGKEGTRLGTFGKNGQSVVTYVYFAPTNDPRVLTLFFGDEGHGVTSMKFIKGTSWIQYPYVTKDPVNEKALLEATNNVVLDVEWEPLIFRNITVFKKVLLKDGEAYHMKISMKETLKKVVKVVYGEKTLWEKKGDEEFKATYLYPVSKPKFVRVDVSTREGDRREYYRYYSEAWFQLKENFYQSSLERYYKHLSTDFLEVNMSEVEQYRRKTAFYKVYTKNLYDLDFTLLAPNHSYQFSSVVYRPEKHAVDGAFTDKADADLKKLYETTVNEFMGMAGFAPKEDPKFLILTTYSWANLLEQEGGDYSYFTGDVSDLMDQQGREVNKQVYLSVTTNYYYKEEGEWYMADAHSFMERCKRYAHDNMEPEAMFDVDLDNLEFNRDKYELKKEEFCDTIFTGLGPKKGYKIGHVYQYGKIVYRVGPYPIREMLFYPETKARFLKFSHQMSEKLVNNYFFLSYEPFGLYQKDYPSFRAELYEYNRKKKSLGGLLEEDGLSEEDDINVKLFEARGEKNTASKAPAHSFLYHVDTERTATTAYSCEYAKEAPEFQRAVRVFTGKMCGLMYYIVVPVNGFTVTQVFSETKSLLNAHEGTKVKAVVAVPSTNPIYLLVWHEEEPAETNWSLYHLSGNVWKELRHFPLRLKMSNIAKYHLAKVYPDRFSGASLPQAKVDSGAATTTVMPATTTFTQPTTSLTGSPPLRSLFKTEQSPAGDRFLMHGYPQGPEHFKEKFGFKYDFFNFSQVDVMDQDDVFRKLDFYTEAEDAYKLVLMDYDEYKVDRLTVNEKTVFQLPDEDFFDIVDARSGSAPGPQVAHDLANTRPLATTTGQKAGTKDTLTTDPVKCAKFDFDLAKDNHCTDMYSVHHLTHHGYKLTLVKVKEHNMLMHLVDGDHKVWTNGGHQVVFKFAFLPPKEPRELFMSVYCMASHKKYHLFLYKEHGEWKRHPYPHEAPEHLRELVDPASTIYEGVAHCTAPPSYGAAQFAGTANVTGTAQVVGTAQVKPAGTTKVTGTTGNLATPVDTAQVVTTTGNQMVTTDNLTTDPVKCDKFDLDLAKHHESNEYYSYWRAMYFHGHEYAVLRVRQHKVLNRVRDGDLPVWSQHKDHYATELGLLPPEKPTHVCVGEYHQKDHTVKYKFLYKSEGEWHEYFAHHLVPESMLNVAKFLASGASTDSALKTDLKHNKSKFDTVKAVVLSPKERPYKLSVVYSEGIHDRYASFLKVNGQWAPVTLPMSDDLTLRMRYLGAKLRSESIVFAGEYPYAVDVNTKMLKYKYGTFVHNSVVSSKWLATHSPEEGHLVYLPINNFKLLRVSFGKHKLFKYNFNTKRVTAVYLTRAENWKETARSNEVERVTVFALDKEDRKYRASWKKKGDKWVMTHVPTEEVMKMLNNIRKAKEMLPKTTEKRERKEAEANKAFENFMDYTASEGTLNTANRFTLSGKVERKDGALTVNAYFNYRIELNEMEVFLSSLKTQFFNYAVLEEWYNYNIVVVPEGYKATVLKHLGSVANNNTTDKSRDEYFIKAVYLTPASNPYRVYLYLKNGKGESKYKYLWKSAVTVPSTTENTTEFVTVSTRYEWLSANMTETVLAYVKAKFTNALDASESLKVSCYKYDLKVAANGDQLQKFDYYVNLDSMYANMSYKGMFSYIEEDFKVLVPYKDNKVSHVTFGVEKLFTLKSQFDTVKALLLTPPSNPRNLIVYYVDEEGNDHYAAYTKMNPLLYYCNGTFGTMERLQSHKRFEGVKRQWFERPFFGSHATAIRRIHAALDKYYKLYPHAEGVTTVGQRDGEGRGKGDFVPDVYCMELYVSGKLYDLKKGAIYDFFYYYDDKNKDLLRVFVDDEIVHVPGVLEVVVREGKPTSFLFITAKVSAAASLMVSSIVYGSQEVMEVSDQLVVLGLLVSPLSDPKAMLVHAKNFSGRDLYYYFVKKDNHWVTPESDHYSFLKMKVLMEGARAELSAAPSDSAATLRRKEGVDGMASGTMAWPEGLPVGRTMSSGVYPQEAKNMDVYMSGTLVDGETVAPFVYVYNARKVGSAHVMERGKIVEHKNVFAVEAEDTQYRTVFALKPKHKEYKVRTLHVSRERVFEVDARETVNMVAWTPFANPKSVMVSVTTATGGTRHNFYAKKGNAWTLCTEDWQLSSLVHEFDISEADAADDASSLSMVEKVNYDLYLTGLVEYDNFVYVFDKDSLDSLFVLKGEKLELVRNAVEYKVNETINVLFVWPQLPRYVVTNVVSSSGVLLEVDRNSMLVALLLSPPYDPEVMAVHQNDASGSFYKYFMKRDGQWYLPLVNPPSYYRMRRCLEVAEAERFEATGVAHCTAPPSYGAAQFAGTANVTGTAQVVGTAQVKPAGTTKVTGTTGNLATPVDTAQVVTTTGNQMVTTDNLTTDPVKCDKFDLDLAKHHESNEYYSYWRAMYFHGHEYAVLRVRQHKVLNRVRDGDLLVWSQHKDHYATELGLLPPEKPTHVCVGEYHQKDHTVKYKFLYKSAGEWHEYASRDRVPLQLVYLSELNFNHVSELSHGNFTLHLNEENKTTEMYRFEEVKVDSFKMAWGLVNKGYNLDEVLAAVGAGKGAPEASRGRATETVFKNEKNRQVLRFAYTPVQDPVAFGCSYVLDGETHYELYEKASEGWNPMYTISYLRTALAYALSDEYHEEYVRNNWKELTLELSEKRLEQVEFGVTTRTGVTAVTGPTVATARTGVTAVTDAKHTTDAKQLVNEFADQMRTERLEEAAGATKHVTSVPVQKVVFDLHFDLLNEFYRHRYDQELTVVGGLTFVTFVPKEGVSVREVMYPFVSVYSLPTEETLNKISVYPRDEPELLLLHLTYAETPSHYDFADHLSGGALLDVVNANSHNVNVNPHNVNNKPLNVVRKFVLVKGEKEEDNRWVLSEEKFDRKVEDHAAELMAPELEEATLDLSKLMNLEGSEEYDVVRDTIKDTVDVLTVYTRAVTTKVTEGDNVVWEAEKGQRLDSLYIMPVEDPELLSLASTSKSLSYYARHGGKWESVTREAFYYISSYYVTARHTLDLKYVTEYDEELSPEDYELEHSKGYPEESHHRLSEEDSVVSQTFSMLRQSAFGEARSMFAEGDEEMSVKYTKTRYHEYLETGVLKSDNRLFGLVYPKEGVDNSLTVLKHNGDVIYRLAENEKLEQVNYYSFDSPVLVSVVLRVEVEPLEDRSEAGARNERRWHQVDEEHYNTALELNEYSNKKGLGLMFGKEVYVRERAVPREREFSFELEAATRITSEYYLRRMSQSGDYYALVVNLGHRMKEVTEGGEAVFRPQEGEVIIDLYYAKEAEASSLTVKCVKEEDGVTYMEFLHMEKEGGAWAKKDEIRVPVETIEVHEATLATLATKKRALGGLEDMKKFDFDLRSAKTGETEDYLLLVQKMPPIETALLTPKEKRRLARLHDGEETVWTSPEDRLCRQMMFAPFERPVFVGLATDKGEGSNPLDMEYTFVQKVRDGKWRECRIPFVKSKETLPPCDPRYFRTMKLDVAGLVDLSLGNRDRAAMAPGSGVAKAYYAVPKDVIVNTVCDGETTLFTSPVMSVEKVKVYATPTDLFLALTTEFADNMTTHYYSTSNANINASNTTDANLNANASMNAFLQDHALRSFDFDLSADNHSTKHYKVRVTEGAHPAVVVEVKRSSVLERLYDDHLLLWKKSKQKHVKLVTKFAYLPPKHPSHLCMGLYHVYDHKVKYTFFYKSGRVWHRYRPEEALPNGLFLAFKSMRGEARADGGLAQSAHTTVAADASVASVTVATDASVASVTVATDASVASATAPKSADSVVATQSSLVQETSRVRSAFDYDLSVRNQSTQDYEVNVYQYHGNETLAVVTPKPRGNLHAVVDGEATVWSNDGTKKFMVFAYLPSDRPQHFALRFYVETPTDYSDVYMDKYQGRWIPSYTPSNRFLDESIFPEEALEGYGDADDLTLGESSAHCSAPVAPVASTSGGASAPKDTAGMAKGAGANVTGDRGVTPASLNTVVQCAKFDFDLAKDNHCTDMYSVHHLTHHGYKLTLVKVKEHNMLMHLVDGDHKVWTNGGHQVVFKFAFLPPKEPRELFMSVYCMASHKKYHLFLYKEHGEWKRHPYPHEVPERARALSEVLRMSHFSFNLREKPTASYNKYRMDFDNKALLELDESTYLDAVFDGDTMVWTNHGSKKVKAMVYYPLSEPAHVALSYTRDDDGPFFEYMEKVNGKWKHELTPQSLKQMLNSTLSQSNGPDGSSPAPKTRQAPLKAGRTWTRIDTAEFYNKFMHVAVTGTFSKLDLGTRPDEGMYEVKDGFVYGKPIRVYNPLPGNHVYRITKGNATVWSFLEFNDHVKSVLAVYDKIDEEADPRLLQVYIKNRNTIRARYFKCKSSKRWVEVSEKEYARLYRTVMQIFNGAVTEESAGDYWEHESADSEDDYEASTAATTDTEDPRAFIGSEDPSLCKVEYQSLFDRMGEMARDLKEYVESKYAKYAGVAKPKVDTQEDTTTSAPDDTDVTKQKVDTQKYVEPGIETKVDTDEKVAGEQAHPLNKFPQVNGGESIRVNVMRNDGTTSEVKLGCDNRLYAHLVDNATIYVPVEGDEMVKVKQDNYVFYSLEYATKKAQAVTTEGHDGIVTKLIVSVENGEAMKHIGFALINGAWESYDVEGTERESLEKEVERAKIKSSSLDFRQRYLRTLTAN